MSTVQSWALSKFLNIPYTKGSEKSITKEWGQVTSLWFIHYNGKLQNHKPPKPQATSFFVVNQKQPQRSKTERRTKEGSYKEYIFPKRRKTEMHEATDVKNDNTCNIPDKFRTSWLLLLFLVSNCRVIIFFKYMCDVYKYICSYWIFELIIQNL